MQPIHCIFIVFILSICNKLSVSSPLPPQAHTPKWRPVVVMHGIMAGSDSMDTLMGWLQQDFPGIYVKNVEIGNGKDDSLFTGMNTQVEIFAKAVQSDPNLQQGFNLLGYSQGGLITRAYVERYNNPPVYNLISWLGPQDGVYGCPDFNVICPDADCPWFNSLFDDLLKGAPSVFLQDHVSIASYWKHPFHFDEYLKTNTFLADINNEKSQKNQKYKDNILSLNSYMLMHSTTDTVVIPSVSPWFYFFAENSTSTLIPIYQSKQYLEDWIGLRTLHLSNRLIFTATDCPHQHMPQERCKDAYDKQTRQYFNNTL